MKQRLSKISFNSFVLGTVTLTGFEKTNFSCSNDHQLELASGLWWHVFTSLALEPCIVQTTADPLQAVSVCEFTCVLSIPYLEGLFPWHLSLPLILKLSLLSHSQDSLIPEGWGDLMEKSHLVLSVSHSQHIVCVKFLCLFSFTTRRTFSNDG